MLIFSDSSFVILFDWNTNTSNKEKKNVKKMENWWMDKSIIKQKIKYMEEHHISIFISTKYTEKPEFHHSDTKAINQLFKIKIEWNKHI